MRALLLQYIQTRESHAISTPGEEIMSDPATKRKNVSACVINRDRSEWGNARYLRYFIRTNGSVCTRLFFITHIV